MGGQGCGEGGDVGRGGGCSLKRQVAFEWVRKTLVMKNRKMDRSHHGLSEDLKGTRSGSTSGVDMNGVRRLEVVLGTAGSQHFSSQYEQGSQFAQ